MLESFFEAYNKMIKIPQTRINTEFFITKEKHRPRSSYVCKNSVLSAPSGVRTLDTLIKRNQRCYFGIVKSIIISHISPNFCFIA